MASSVRCRTGLSIRSLAGRPLAVGAADTAGEPVLELRDHGLAQFQEYFGLPVVEPVEDQAVHGLEVSGCGLLDLPVSGVGEYRIRAAAPGEHLPPGPAQALQFCYYM